MTELDYLEERIYDESRLTQAINRWRLVQDQVVFTNGCFDLIHPGHIQYLAQASDLGHRLIVGVNSDSSVKRLKGEGRPLQNERARSMIMASLRFVDAVILFNEDTPFELIKKVQPDILVKGGDYDPEVVDPSDPKYIVGSDIVRSYGGQVASLAFVEGQSTTRIIESMED